MKRFICFFLIFVLALSFVSCSKLQHETEQPKIEFSETEPAEPGDDFCWKNYPGEIIPEIMVDEKIYYWDGESKRHYGTEQPYATVYQMGDGKTYLPKDFSEYGEISSVTEKTPTKNLQIMADFEVSGTVYKSETDTEAVYILMTAENIHWPKEQYIRFISAELLEGEHIAYGGKLFRIYWGGNLDSTYVDNLPENAVHIGNLEFIGIDKLPENDFETNCPNDSYSKAFTGRDIFYDSDEPDYIYVLSERYSSAGTFERYVKCPVIE